MMRTFKIHLFNDQSKEVKITLTKQNIKLFAKIFSLKNNSEIHNWLLAFMEQSLEREYDGDFQGLKYEFESQLVQALEQEIMEICSYYHSTGQKDFNFFEAVNRLATTHQFTAHYASDDPRIEMCKQKVFQSFAAKQAGNNSLNNTI